MILLISSIVDVARGSNGGLVVLAVWGVALVIEKSISVYHSNHFIKEFIPKDKDIKPMAGVR